MSSTISSSGSTFVVLLCLFFTASAFKCTPKGSVKDADRLQIHLVPHSHDDVGWLKTVDEYFYGANNSIQHAGVQYILDSVIPALLADPAKRFIYVEIAFFQRWWDEQTSHMKETVKKLVANRQLEFINGGWCMNDEAATHYNAIIDQMTLGLKFVEDTFGPEARPRIAWHIDPFGHSSEQASLFSQMSFDGFFLGRIDYADKKKRVAEQRMEMVWRGSKNLGKDSQIFAGVLYNRYDPPPGFCFDQFCADPPIQDDPRLYDLNVKERVASFVNETCSQAEHYRTNHIILTMGADFQYENAHLWYKNLDKLITYVNQDGRVNAFYSTPTLYLDALHSANLTWEVKTDDFFPYADCPHCYWTGYFTSRPALKRYVRLNNNLLQACKQLEVIGGPVKKGAPSSDLLKRAMGVAQHHDAVSGTSKQHVADDYAKRLAIGAAECQVVISGVLETFTSKKTPSNDPPKMSFCDYLNISSCPVTEESKSFTVTVYNPLARDINTVLRLPVSHSSMAVFSPQGKPVKSQVLPVSQQTKTLRQEQKQNSNASYELVFTAKVPLLGFATYFVNVTASQLKHFQAHKSNSPDLEDSDVTIENDHFRLVFSKDNGHVTSMTNLASKDSISIDQQFFWYNGSSGNAESKQSSGAYIFRPNSSTPFTLTKDNKATISVFQGPLVQEVRQVFSPFVSQVVRLYAGQPYAEFEYTVGPIPIDDHLGKEIISRFDTDIKSNSLFYTDANGREMQERKRNYRPTWTLNNTEPVAGNYYPINSRIYIRDNKNQLNILTDRSLGGASLKDGSVEVMVHRRLLVDDRRGVGEPLNETGINGKGLIIRGKFFVTLSPPEIAARLHREIGEQQLLGPVLAFAPNPMTVEKWLSQYHSLYSGLTRELPANVHLLSVETMDGEALIRVEHQYESGEDTKFSKPVNISLEKLFTSFEIESVTEMNLAANQLLKDKKRLEWNTKTGVEEYGRKVQALHKRTSSNDLNVELSPMQIRTFKAVIKYNDGYTGKYSRLHAHV